MAIAQSNQAQSNSQTGVVLVVFRDPDVPVDTKAIIERTVESASVADNTKWQVIGELNPCDVAGSHFIDLLPLSPAKYFYRAKHVAPGFDDSDYIFEVSGSANIIPDIDFSKKPWLLDTPPLQLVMAVTDFNSGSWTVSPLVNQPVFGSSVIEPTIELFASGNVGTITSGSNSVYTINRPAGAAALTGSYAVFRSTLPGFIPGIDLVELTPFDDIDENNFLQLLLTVSASNNDTIGVSCSIANPIPDALFFGVASASNVGTITKNGSAVFTIPRPSSGIGSVLFYVTSSNAQYIPDYDMFYVEPDFNLTPDQFLNLNLTVTSSTLTTVGVSASCDTSFPVGFGIVNSNNVGTITQNGTGRWTVTRPSSGEGSVTFIVTSSNATVVPDTDTLFISKDPAPYLTVRSSNIASNNNSVTASVEVFDSNNQSSTLTGITIQVASGSLTGLTVTQSGSVQQATGKNTYNYLITRPTYNQGTGRVTFTATKTGYTQDSDSLEIPEKVENLARLRTVIVPVGTTATTLTVNVTALDALPLTGNYINLASSRTNIPAISPATPVTLAAGGTQQYVITRPDFGTGTGRVNFTATASNRVPDTDAIDVPEKPIDSTAVGLATITIGTALIDADQITIPYTFASSSRAESVQVFVQETSGSQPAITSVEFTGTRVAGSPLYRNDGRTQIIIPVAQPSNYVLVTFVPFDVIGRRATPQTFRYQAASVILTPPNAPTNPTNTSVSSTSVTNTVTMPASNLPDNIRIYQNNTAIATIARTASANGTQTIVHGDLNPSTTYLWQYSGVNNNGAESALTSTVTTTTSGVTLTTPTLVFTGWSAANGGELTFVISNTGDYPDGTTFEGRVYNSSNQIIEVLFQRGNFSLYAPFAGPGTTVGEADARAVKTGFTTSNYSTRATWDNTGSENPI